jgi:integrase
MLVLLFKTGMRVEELISLNVGDVDLDKEAEICCTILRILFDHKIYIRKVNWIK